MASASSCRMILHEVALMWEAVLGNPARPPAPEAQFVGPMLPGLEGRGGCQLLGGI